MHREIAVLNRTYMAGAETCSWRQSSHDKVCMTCHLVVCVCVCIYVCVVGVCVWLWRRGQARIKQAWQARLAGSHVQLPEAVGMCMPKAVQAPRVTHNTGHVHVVALCVSQANVLACHPVLFLHVGNKAVEAQSQIARTAQPCRAGRGLLLPRRCTAAIPTAHACGRRH